MSDFYSRLLAEKTELDERIGRLIDFQQSEAFQKIEPFITFASHAGERPAPKDKQGSPVDRWGFFIVDMCRIVGETRIQYALYSHTCIP